MARQSKPWYRADRDTWSTIIGGRRYVLARGKGAKEEALAAFYELKAELRKGRGRPLALAAAALFDLFLEHAQKDLRPLTYEGYCRHLNGLIGHVGKEIAAEDLRPFHVAEWLGTRRWSNTTRHSAITTVKVTMAWGRKQGYIGRSLIEDMARPTPRRRNDIMTDEQAARLLEGASDQQFRDLLVALRETGARPSEIMALEAAMIDRERGVAVLRSKTSERTGVARTIHLTPTMLALCLRLAERWPVGPIFRNRSGRPWSRNNMAQRFGRLRRKIGGGAEVTAESYRHMFATDALERGVPIATVAELMGHRSTDILSRTYSHLHDRREHLAEALGRVRPAGTSAVAT